MVTERQQAILQHINEFRVTTIDAVQTLFYAERTREAARVSLFRMTEQEVIRRFEVRNRSFYQLTAKGCVAIGAPSSAARLLQAQGLIERYSFLAFCVLRESPQQRLGASDLVSAFPELSEAPDVDPALQHYFLEERGSNIRLARAVVDNGAEVTRLVAKCRIIERKAVEGSLQRICQADRFALVVLTPFASKRQRINQLLWRDPPTIPISVEVVPQMLHLL